MAAGSKTTTQPEPERLLTWSLHLLVLFGLALAQPLYDLLARYPQFFVARHSGLVELGLLTLALSLLFPALFLLPDAVLLRLYPRLLPWWRNSLILLLLCLIALPVLKRAGMESAAILLPTALFLSAAATYAYRRFPFIRLFVSLLIPSILIFPSIFLLGPGISTLVYTTQSSSESELQLSAPAQSDAPLVMVVFDELPLNSLLNREGEIDPLRFPNFAALARDSYWFPETQTISDSTMHAVPALVTGRHPERRRLPIATEHFPTLFNLLAGSHRMKVIESVTQLCPVEICDSVFATSALDRLESLASDLSIIYGHLILPGKWASKLPGVRQNWGNFADRGFPLKDRFQRASGDAVRTFELFLASLKREDSTSFYFLHTPLPHSPWIYLPSGKQHGSRKALRRLRSGSKWIEDESAVGVALQLHLLQVGFVDRLLGRLIKRLKEEDLYDRSLIVIVADHGISFIPGLHPRRLHLMNYRQILSVPLLIKAPGQDRGQRIDGRVETIDLLPTISDILKLEIPWPMNGSSLLSKSPPKRRKRRVFTGHKEYLFWEDPAETLSNTFLCRNGMNIPTDSESVTARLDFAQETSTEIRFIGWAVDEEDRRAADRILVFADHRLVSDQSVNVSRPDVARFYSDHRFIRSGFDFTLPRSTFEETSRVRLFALLKDQVAETKYPQDYPWSAASSEPTTEDLDWSPLTICADVGNRSSTFLIERRGLTAELIGEREQANRIIRRAATADPDGFLREGPFRELIGAEAENLKQIPASGIKIRIDQEDKLENVDPNGPFVPALLMGEVSGKSLSSEGRLILAVAVNGTIRAVNPTTRIKDAPTAFFSIVPEASFRAGSNQVELFVVRESPEGYLLEKTL